MEFLPASSLLPGPFPPPRAVQLTASLDSLLAPLDPKRATPPLVRRDARSPPTLRPSSCTCIPSRANRSSDRLPADASASRTLDALPRKCASASPRAPASRARPRHQLSVACCRVQRTAGGSRSSFFCCLRSCSQPLASALYRQRCLHGQALDAVRETSSSLNRRGSYSSWRRRDSSRRLHPRRSRRQTLTCGPAAADQPAYLPLAQSARRPRHRATASPSSLSAPGPAAHSTAPYAVTSPRSPRCTSITSATRRRRALRPLRHDSPLARRVVSSSSAPCSSSDSAPLPQSHQRR